MTILRPDHFTVLTDDLTVTEAFYTNLLDFTVGPRPEFSFPGIWFYSGEKAILHVVQVDEMPNPRNGVLDHMAFRSEDINALLGKLKAADVEYRVKRLPERFNDWQVFFHDPNGAKVEVDFDGVEEVDPGT